MASGDLIYKTITDLTNYCWSLSMIQCPKPWTLSRHVHICITKRRKKKFHISIYISSILHWEVAGSWNKNHLKNSLFISVGMWNRCTEEPETAVRNVKNTRLERKLFQWFHHRIETNTPPHLFSIAQCKWQDILLRARDVGGSSFRLALPYRIKTW